MGLFSNTDPDKVHLVSAARWVKSSLSFANGNCVEVAGLADGMVAVRNSRDPGPVQVYTADEWQAFIGGVKNGEFDRPSGAWPEGARP